MAPNHLLACAIKHPLLIDRGEWGRYTRGCDAIVYVVDAADYTRLQTARIELHRLLEDRGLAGMPLLVLANKIDKQPHVGEPELIRELNLDYITENPWVVIPCSALHKLGIEGVIEWLTQHSRA